MRYPLVKDLEHELERKFTRAPVRKNSRDSQITTMTDQPYKVDLVGRHMDQDSSMQDDTRSIHLYNNNHLVPRLAKGLEYIVKKAE